MEGIKGLGREPSERGEQLPFEIKGQGFRRRPRAILRGAREINQPLTRQIRDAELLPVEPWRGLILLLLVWKTLSGR